MARKKDRLPRPGLRPPPLPIKEEGWGGHYTQWPLPPRPRPAHKEQETRDDAEMNSLDFSDPPAGAEE